MAGTWARLKDTTRDATSASSSKGPGPTSSQSAEGDALEEPLLPGSSGGTTQAANGPRVEDGPAIGAGLSRGSQRTAAEFLQRLQPAGRGSVPRDSKFFNTLRQRSIAGRVDESRVTKFIVRLATALHAYGSSAARTEYLVERAAERLQVDVDISVFPTLILLCFGDPNEDALKRHTVLLQVTQDLDVDKLGRVDELARHVGQNKHEILVAYWQLRSIANSKPTFSLPWRLLAFLLMAAAAAPLFYGGSWHDAVVGGALGLTAGVIEIWASKHSPVAFSVLEFVVAIMAAFVTRAVIAQWGSFICFYPTALAALVWYLPGLSLTLGVNELVAKTYVSGSSHIVAAIFSAFQLGFGVAFGANLVFWAQEPLDQHCSAQVLPLPLWAKAAWFCAYVVASNILLNARFDQWPGMVIVALVGYVMSEATTPLGNEASSILSAFAISISGTICSRWRNQFPLAMKMSGILVLVPGGIGVSGVAKILQDSSSGTIFVFEMLMVALAITLGLLMGKVFLPEGVFGYSHRASRVDKKKMAEQMREERWIDSLGRVEEEEREGEEGIAF